MKKVLRKKFRKLYLRNIKICLSIMSDKYNDVTINYLYFVQYIFANGDFKNSRTDVKLNVFLYK